MLLIPFALDEKNRLYSPQDAQKGKSYFCPSCRKPVLLRRGDIKAAHFAHKADAACSQETVVHETAKLLIQKTIRDWKSGYSGAPIVRRECSVCFSTADQPLPEKVEDAVLEHRLPNGLIADVALVTDNTVQAVIEIRVTHAVDADKASRLQTPFIELDGNEVLSDPFV